VFRIFVIVMDLMFQYRYHKRQPLGPNLGGPGRKWEDNIKIDFKEITCGVVECIRVAHGRVRCLALVNKIMTS
jgi:hypothetical protein